MLLSLWVKTIDCGLVNFYSCSSLIHSFNTLWLYWKWALKQVFFLSDFLFYHYFDFWYYRSLLYYGKFKKESGNDKSKLRTIYPKNHEKFKNSKPRVQFYWFLLKKECTVITVFFDLYSKLTWISKLVIKVN